MKSLKSIAAVSNFVLDGEQLEVSHNINPYTGTDITNGGVAQ